MRPRPRSRILRGNSSSREDAMNVEYVPTIVVGGGQAGLATGRELQRRGLPFVILDASDRIGD